jgi:type I restriction enzyme, S subunit
MMAQPWLSETPTDWPHIELRELGSMFGGGTPSTDDESFWSGRIPWVSPKDMKSWHISDAVDHITAEAVQSSATRIIPKGSLLLVVRSGILQHTIPVGLLTVDAALNQDMKGMVPRAGVELRFIAYWIAGNQDALLPYWRKLGATVESLDVDIVRRTRVALPPPNVQTSIANYLDLAAGRVDTLVAKKRMLVERLKEKRTALISRAVTRGLPPDAARAAGLDPHPKLKPSGIDWLGDLPAHWETTRVSHQFRNLDHRRIPVAGEDRADLEKIYPYYGASGIIDHVDTYLFDEPLILVAEDGANLLSRSTPLAFLAAGKYWVNNHAHILRPIEGDIRYWVAVLQTHDYTPLITGAAQPKLTAERLSGIMLPRPPSAEQLAIADFLEREGSKIDQMITKIESVIARLQEYRTALITAAVTGKIDVRQLVAKGARA